ncbi:23071_t:CDS:1, partial [Gigaspora margarita]
NEQTRNNKIPKSINRTNFTYTEEKRRRILADSEIERLLKKLNLIDPLLANTWCQSFKYNRNNNIEIIESKIKYLENFIITEFKQFLK